MDRVLSMARRLASERDEWTLNGNLVEVALAGAGRHQSVLIREQGDEFVLTSVVLGSAFVTKPRQRWQQLTKLAWMRNADHQIVTFAFDRRHRLRGNGGVRRWIGPRGGFLGQRLDEIDQRATVVDCRREIDPWIQLESEIVSG